MHVLVGVVTLHQGTGVVFNISGWQLAGLLVATVLPLLVGLVTKVVTSPTTKALLLAALSAVTGLGSQALAAHSDGVNYDLGQGLLLALTAFLIAVGMHFGLWRPTTATARVQAIGPK